MKHPDTEGVGIVLSVVVLFHSGLSDGFSFSFTTFSSVI
jgi:hypothetical protein